MEDALHDMDRVRRELLKLVGKASAATIGCAMISRSAGAATATISGAGAVFDVRSFGALGDGKAIDSPAINQAIEVAVYFPAGLYACYSLRLKSAVALYLDQGSVIIAADTPREGTTSGYDPLESNAPWEAFSKTSDTITGTTA